MKILKLVGVLAVGAILGISADRSLQWFAPARTPLLLPDELRKQFSDQRTYNLITTGYPLYFSWDADSKLFFATARTGGGGATSFALYFCPITGDRLPDLGRSEAAMLEMRRRQAELQSEPKGKSDLEKGAPAK